MRQRLLLIAGWAVAAFGSSVVASGAVAVAGGQVTDRPLRLLSASQVEAIPIVSAAVRPAVSEPLASGGSADSPGAPGGVADTTAGRADRQSPAGDGGATRGSPPTGGGPSGNTAAPTSGAAFVDEPDPGRLDPTDPAAAEPSLGPVAADPPEPVDLPHVRLTPDGVHVISLSGGSAAITGSEGTVDLLWALPRPGYTMQLDFVNPEALDLAFVRNGVASSAVRAVWHGNKLTVELTTD